MGFAPLVTVTTVISWLLDLPNSYLLQTLVLYALLAGVIFWFVPDKLPGRGLGAANRVTLARAILLLPVAALVAQPEILRNVGYWLIIVMSTIAMLLDGVDGWVARRTGTSTTFGARLDMELDAFFLLALAMLVWLSGKVGPWVILIGVIRYLFVAAGWAWPALQATLPPSQRRKTICVVQGIGLLVCLGPITPASLAFVTEVVALGLLVYSFVQDVRWLVRAADTLP